MKLSSGNIQRSLMALCLGLTISLQQVAVAQAVEEEKPSFLAMTGDLLFVRPLMLVTTVAGTAVFLVSLPFSAAGGNADQAAEVLVQGPFETTFVRCLGCSKPKRWSPERGMEVAPQPQPQQAVVPSEPVRTSR